MLNGVGIMLHQLFKNMGYLNKKKIDTDLTNHNFETFNPSDAHIHQKIIEIYKDFFDTTGRFPGNQRLISVPRGRIPDFIQSEDVILPRYMYERYLSRDMSGIVGVQFLAALNRYLGGEIEISRNAMSEFFHNLLWQALAADNDGILLQFEAIRELTHSVYNLLQREMNNERADSIRSGINFTNILSKNFTDKTRTVQDTVEDNLVQDIINNDQTNYRPQYTFPRPKTEDEIEKARVDENINFIEGELAKNACDFEIAADIEAQEKADLLRNILDPGFGLTTNEDVSALDAIRNNNGDSAIPHLDPVALRGMEQLLDNLKETIDLSEDETEDVKLPPEAVYPPIADVKAPDLQDLLTDDNQNSGILDDIREIRDNVKTEVEDISSPPPPDDFPGDFDDTEFSDNYPPNPFRGATAPPFPDEAPPYPGLPTAPPYPHDELPPPPNYDDLFGKPLRDPVPVNFIPLSDGEISDDDIRPRPPNPRQIYTLEVDSDGDAGDLIGNPNVNVILSPIEGDPNFPPFGDPNFNPNPYYTDEESLEDPGYNDDDIDFTTTASENTTTGSLLYNDRRNELFRRNAKRKALKTLAKKRQRKIAAAKNRKKPQIIPEFDNDKIIIDDEGEVIMTDPDNALIDYNSTVPYYKEIIQLPADNDSYDRRTN